MVNYSCNVLIRVLPRVAVFVYFVVYACGVLIFYVSRWLHFADILPDCIFYIPSAAAFRYIRLGQLLLFVRVLVFPDISLVAGLLFLWSLDYIGPARSGLY